MENNSNLNDSFENILKNYSNLYSADVINVITSDKELSKNIKKNAPDNVIVTSVKFPVSVIPVDDVFRHCIDFNKLAEEIYEGNKSEAVSSIKKLLTGFCKYNKISYFSYQSVPELIWKYIFVPDYEKTSFDEDVEALEYADMYNNKNVTVVTDNRISLTKHIENLSTYSIKSIHIIFLD